MDWLRRPLALLMLLAWMGSRAASSSSLPTAFGHHRLQPSASRSGCQPMPRGLVLCQGVGYGEMWLPNLLGHETPREVLQQAAAWVPLLAKRCHQDAQKFLCSLFAPVCLDEMEGPILPCWSLCRDVQEGCAPIMAAFGFPWPEMLNCTRFPEEDDLCIPPEKQQGPQEDDHPTAHRPPHKEDGVCAACLEDAGRGEKGLLESLCSQDFALKMSVKSVSGSAGDLKVVPEVRGRTVYKQSGWSEEELKRPVLWLEDGEGCSCRALEATPGAVVLAAGRRMAGRLVLSWVRRWQSGEKELRKLSRTLRRRQCQERTSSTRPSVGSL
ncbi:secreted frizzled-related protein 2-like [Sceloporus undulatus]|uniref:secreted frizzled-related protein 2-like n=1 Tax=Sceloporus undulatus TaxID=8520 RepID=UPI001C4A7B9A|nr:secreted frizzled-related protein 2-like [Sceloporus undulatus]